MALPYLLYFSCLFVFRAHGAAILQHPLGTNSVEFSESASPSFENLLAELQIPFFNVTPVGSPCYTTPGPLNVTRCMQIRQNLTSDVGTSDQPSGYFYPNWASCQKRAETCALPTCLDDTIPTTATCHQGALPTQMFNLSDPSRDIERVQEVLRTAQKTKTSVIIKNTGHDWKGRSSGPAPLAIWTHNYKSPNVPIVRDDYFVPVNCSNRKGETVLHLGGGETWGGAYNFAREHNLTLVGGTCQSVGVAGWLAGGGHSPLTPTWGLGVDNVRQIDIVTPQGDLVVANECQNDDLFFAVRGGGGGTFGVVTSITYKAHKNFEIHNLFVKFNEKAATPEFFTILTKHASNWAKKGWGGYIRPGIYMDLVKNASRPLHEAQEDMAELVAYLKSLGFNPIVETRPSWYEYFDTNHNRSDQHLAGSSLAVGSRLLPPDLFNQTSHLSTAAALREMYRSGIPWKINLLILLVAPTAFADSTIYTSSLHPSWRTAIWNVRFSKGWDEYNDGKSAAFVRGQFAAVHNATDALRTLAPNSGISISEADVWEPDHIQGFWGEKYERLAQIKKRVDPGDVLVNWQGVGWSKEKALAEKRFECYPPPSWF